MNRLRCVCTTTLLASMLALASGMAKAADSGPVPLTRLSLGELGGWIELSVTVNGQAGRWLLDTGSTRHIVSKAFAERHGLVAGAPVGAATALGPVQGRAVALPVLHIGAHEHLGQSALRLDDLRALVGAAGEGLDGVLGVPLLAGLAVDLDLRQWTLGLSEAAPAADCPAGSEALALGTHRGLPVVQLRVNEGGPETLLLDTGNPAAVVRIAADQAAAAEPGLALAGGARLALARQVAAGGWQRTSVPVLRMHAPALHRALAPGVTGLVGTALLDGTRWQLHMAQRRACVERGSLALPGGFGLTLAQKGGALVIDSVLVGGPAEAAGLKAGEGVQRWAGGVASEPLRRLWARVQGQAEIELEMQGADARVLRLKRAYFLPPLP
jgi:hypothetical protein